MLSIIQYLINSGQVAMDNSEITFKTIVIGAPFAGKSALLRKFMRNQFSNQYNVTVGVEFNSKIIQVNQRTAVKLQIWDTAGQETFKAVVRSFYKGVCAVFLIYQIDKVESFQSLKGWVKEVKQNTHEETMLFLIGSKLDLQENRKIEKTEAEEYLRDIGGVYYVEASAKTGENVKQLFERAAKLLFKKYTSSGAFRHLVKPALASGFIASSAQQRLQKSVSKLNKSQVTKPKKSCC